MARRPRPLAPPPRARRPGATKRRALALSLLAVALLLCLGVGFFLARPPTLVITLSEAQVQQRLESVFPVRREVLVVAEVELSRPKVTLSPGADRAGFATDCAVRLLGKARLQGRAYLSGGLRFDAARGDLFLQDARVERLDVPGLPPPYEAAVTAAASEAAGEFLGEYPVYHLPDTAVALPLLGELHLRNVAVEGGVLKVVLGRGRP